MRTLHTLTSAALILIVLATTLTAKNKSTVASYYKTSNIEQSYVKALDSQNQGLRLSAAYYLGEMKSEAAVIKLMSMLRDGNSKEERMMAALSLVKIGDPRGLHLVNRQSIFSDDAQVRNVCQKFYASTLSSDKRN